MRLQPLPLPTFWKTLLPSASTHMKMSDAAAGVGNDAAAKAVDTSISARRFTEGLHERRDAGSVSEAGARKGRECRLLRVHFPHFR